jgi:hypothetical protein
LWQLPTRKNTLDEWEWHQHWPKISPQLAPTGLYELAVPQSTQKYWTRMEELSLEGILYPAPEKSCNQLSLAPPSMTVTIYVIINNMIAND